MTQKLKTAYEDPTAAKIRDAIGAGPTEDVAVTLPQFDREPGAPKPQSPPVTAADWESLRHLPRAALVEIGCGNWDGRLMLFPAAWYDSIPPGYIVESINGEVREFRPATFGDDRRSGFLSYGVAALDGAVAACDAE